MRTTRSRSDAQIFHGMTEAGYGYWGFSPANGPRATTAPGASTARAWTRTACPRTRTARSSTTGSRAARTAPAKPDPPQSAYTNGVVTPHAAFLALRYAPDETVANLRRLAQDFPGLYGNWGFRDSVNVQTGRVSSAYLSLDQGMIMAALGNALGDDVLRKAFADRKLEDALRPVIGVERFSTSD